MLDWSRHRVTINGGAVSGSDCRRQLSFLPLSSLREEARRNDQAARTHSSQL